MRATRHPRARLICCGILGALALVSPTSAQQSSVSVNPAVDGAASTASSLTISQAPGDFNPSALTSESYDPNLPAAPRGSVDEGSAFRLFSVVRGERLELSLSCLNQILSGPRCL
jgi:hypothetical protein